MGGWVGVGASYLPPPCPLSGLRGVPGAPRRLLWGHGRGRERSRCRNIVGPTFIPLLLVRPEESSARGRVGTPQMGRLLNGAFGPSRNFFRHSLGACYTEAARHRHVLATLVGFPRHPPLPQRLLLPSGQTSIHSSRHLSCPNQEPV